MLDEDEERGRATSRGPGEPPWTSITRRTQIALGQRLADRLGRRAVEVAVTSADSSNSPRDRASNSLGSQEDVIAPVLLARPRAAGSSPRPRAAAAGSGCSSSAADQRALARSRGPGDHDQPPGQVSPAGHPHRGLPPRHTDHSTFWTSSRIFSRSALISTTERLISTSLAFEPIVLISRPISWTTNSSFRPAALGLVDDLDVLGQVGPEPDDLLADVAAVGEDGDLADQVLGLDGHPLVLDQRLDPLGEPLLVRRDDLGPALGDPAQVIADGPAQRQQLLGHRPAFLGRGPPRACPSASLDDAGDLGPVLVRVVRRRLPLLDHAGQGQQRAEVDRRPGRDPAAPRS